MSQENPFEIYDPDAWMADQPPPSRYDPIDWLQKLWDEVNAFKQPKRREGISVGQYDIGREVLDPSPPAFGIWVEGGHPETISRLFTSNGFKLLGVRQHPTKYGTNLFWLQRTYKIPSGQGEGEILQRLSRIPGVLRLWKNEPIG